MVEFVAEKAANIRKPMSSASIYKQNELPQKSFHKLKHEAFKYNLQEKKLHHYLLEIKLQFIFWKHCLRYILDINVYLILNIWVGHTNVNALENEKICEYVEAKNSFYSLHFLGCEKPVTFYQP